MNRRIPAALLLLSLLPCLHKLARDERNPPRRAQGDPHAGGSESPVEKREAKHRQRPSKKSKPVPEGITRLDGKAGRRVILGPEHDEMIFEPESTATLGPAASLLTGGYVNEQGRHVFILITPSLVPRDDGGSWVLVMSTIFAVDAGQLAASGFDRLVKHRRNSDQRADLWSVDDAKQTSRTLPPESIKSRPSQYLEPAQRGWIEIEREHDADLIVLTGTPLPDGGFTLQTGWRRAAKSPPLVPGGRGFGPWDAEPRRKL